MAAALAAELQLPLSSWSVQRRRLPGQGGTTIGALAPGNIQLVDEAGGERHGLDAELYQALLRRQARHLARDQRRFGDPDPAELSHRHRILGDEAIRSGLAMGAAVLSLRAFDPASITLAAPVGCRQALEWLQPLTGQVVVRRPVEAPPGLRDWFVSSLSLGPKQMIALLREA